MLGNNAYGQLGVGYGNYETPQTVNFENGRYATYVASGPYHVCAILDDGNLRCWGQNGAGQLGIGQTQWTLHTPQIVNISAGRTVVDISLGHVPYLCNT